MSKRLIGFSILGLLLLYIVFKLIMGIVHHFENPSKKGFPPPTVEVATAQAGMWKDQIETTGTISAIYGIIVRPEVAGRITKIYFESGTFVKAGDPLFQIYPDILQAQLEANEAALALAQVNYDRADQLYAKRVISKETFDQQTANLKAAQANVAQTKAQLVQHNITAQFDGKIGLKMVDEGDYVTAGEDLVPLQQIDPLRVQFSVPDSYINQVTLNSTVAIQVSSQPSRVYMGNIYAVNSAVDPDSRMFSMWAKFPNPDKTLVPGTYVLITVFAGQAKPVIVVPQTAVLYSPQGQYVYKVVDGKAVKTQVTTSLRRGYQMAVTSGLAAGDVVVTAGQVKLFDNMPVKVGNTSTYATQQLPKIEVISFQGEKVVSPQEEVAQSSAISNSTLPDTTPPSTTVNPAVSNSTNKTDKDKTTTQSATEVKPPLAAPVAQTAATQQNNAAANNTSETSKDSSNTQNNNSATPAETQTTENP